MSDTVCEIEGTTVLVCGTDGEPMRGERNATDTIGEAFAQGATLVAIPVARLDPDFFRLETRVLGTFINKFATYGMRLAIVGDISQQVARSAALRDFVYETNRGTQVWFVASFDQLREKLRQE